MFFMDLFHVAIIVLPFLLLWWDFYDKRHVEKEKVLYFLLQYFLVLGIGVQALVTGFSQILFAQSWSEATARPWSPYIWELGMMNISYGVIGILCLWLKGAFWAAAGFGYSLYLILSFLTHMYHAVFEGNLSWGNIGLQVWADLFIAVVVLTLILRGGRQK